MQRKGFGRSSGRNPPLSSSKWLGSLLILDSNLWIIVTILVPRKGFEPSHLAAYASETYVSTIPPPRQIWSIHYVRWFDYRIFFPFSTKKLQRILKFLIFHGAQDGARTRTPEREEDFKSSVSTIPPPGQIICYVIFIFLSVYPSRMSSRFRGDSFSEVWLQCVVFAGLAFPHIYHYPFQMSHRFTDARFLGYGSLSVAHPPPGQVAWL